MYDENYYADLELEERGQELAEQQAEDRREREEAEYYPAEGVY